MAFALASLARAEPYPKVIGALNPYLRAELVLAKTSEDLGPAFKAMTEFHAEAAIVVGDAFLWNQRQQIADLALRSRPPTMFNFVEHVEAGGLMSYGADAGGEYGKSRPMWTRYSEAQSPAIFQLNRLPKSIWSSIERLQTLCD